MTSVCGRSLTSQVCADSVLILHLVCVGGTFETLPKLVHATLEEYRTAESLLYEEVIFDFGTRRKLAAWTKKAAQLGAKLAARNFGRKIIFVTVHSEMRRGDLFAGKDENEKDVTDS